MSDGVAYNPCSACKKDDLCNICELQLYQSGAISVDKWISVDERLPEKYKDVLVYRGDCFDIDFVMSEGRFCIEGVTHWMPLPEPPIMRKEDEGK